MPPIPWYMFGDTECLLLGGQGGALLGRLREMDDSARQSAAADGSQIVGLVAEIVRESGRPKFVWRADQWPSEWDLKLYAPGGRENLALAPGTVWLPWPLDVEDVQLTSLELDKHSVRCGNTLMGAIDTLIDTVPGRKIGQAAIDSAVHRGVEVDALSLLKEVAPSLGRGGCALPDSLTATLDTTIETTSTSLGVNGEGGLHLRLGWQVEEGHDVPETIGPVPKEPLTRKYPCGAFDG